jgi:DNA-binding MarR family transcriptional regulator
MVRLRWSSRWSVTRRRNTADRRVSLIELSADGEVRLAEVEDRVDELRDDVFSTLPEPKREHASCCSASRAAA